MEKGNFRCIKEENSEEENDKQWKNSRIIFKEFKQYLIQKGYKKNLVERQLEYSSYFVMNYFFVYDNELSILRTNDTTIRIFLGNWYIRKTWSPKFKEMKEILSAIFDFFEFIYKNKFISIEQLEEIKQVCKDKNWFENRLKTYKTAKDIEFRKWVEDYNYD